MKIKELAEKAKAAHPGSLGNLPDGKVNLLTRTLFALIKEELDNTAEGAVKIAFLGQFKVRNVEVEKDGEKIQHRRIQFIPAVVRAAAEGEEAEADDGLDTGEPEPADEPVPATAEAL